MVVRDAFCSSSSSRSGACPAARAKDQLFQERFRPSSSLSGDMAEGASSGELTGSLTNSMLPPPRTRIFKIIVIGDSGVGKTCLTYRFCAGKFPEKTEATIGVDFRERLVEIDGEKIKVRTG